MNGKEKVGEAMRGGLRGCELVFVMRGLAILTWKHDGQRLSVDESALFQSVNKHSVRVSTSLNGSSCKFPIDSGIRQRDEKFQHRPLFQF